MKIRRKKDGLIAVPTNKGNAGWTLFLDDGYRYFNFEDWEEVPDETWADVTDEFTVSEDKEEWKRPGAVLTHSTHYTMCLEEGYEWRKEEAYVIPFATVIDDRFRHRGREIEQEFERYRVPVLRIMRRRD